MKNSNAMELEGLKRGLEFLEGYDLTIGELITDRHIQIKKYMKEEHTDKQHYFDVWHVAKGLYSIISVHVEFGFRRFL